MIRDYSMLHEVIDAMCDRCYPIKWMLGEYGMWSCASWKTYDSQLAVFEWTFHIEEGTQVEAKLYHDFDLGITDYRIETAEGPSVGSQAFLGLGEFRKRLVEVLARRPSYIKGLLPCLHYSRFASTWAKWDSARDYHLFEGATEFPPSF